MMASPRRSTIWPGAWDEPAPAARGAPSSANAWGSPLPNGPGDTPRLPAGPGDTPPLPAGAGETSPPAGQGDTPLPAGSGDAPLPAGQGDTPRLPASLPLRVAIDGNSWSMPADSANGGAESLQIASAA